MANEKRLIDAVAYCKALREEMDYLLELDKTKGYNTLKERMGLEVAIADLGDMPTVDAVEVVRCNDCKYCIGTSASSTNIACSKGVNWRAVEPYDFCSYGERRGGE